MRRLAFRGNTVWVNGVQAYRIGVKDRGEFLSTVAASVHWSCFRPLQLFLHIVPVLYTVANLYTTAILYAVTVLYTIAVSYCSCFRTLINCAGFRPPFQTALITDMQVSLRSRSIRAPLFPMCQKGVNDEDADPQRLTPATLACCLLYFGLCTSPAIIAD